MNKRISILLGLLIVAALACTISFDGVEPGGVVDTVATSVALTLEASGGIPPGGGASPTDTPTVAAPPAPAVLRVAYVDGGDLWVWTEGGAAVEVYDGADNVTDVRLSDNGQLVAFTTFDGTFNFTGLHSVHTDGTGYLLLVNAAAMNALSAEPAALGAWPYKMEFVPFTHTVAFNTRLVFEGPGLAIQDDLHLVDADTASFTTFLTAGSAGQFFYSPDGSQIAISTPTEIHLINADGTNPRGPVLTYTAVITYSEYQFYAVPIWAPDSSHLRVVIPSADILAPDANMQVFHILTDGSAASPMVTVAHDSFLSLMNSPLSPNLNLIAYPIQVGAPEANTYDLWVSGADGSSLVMLYSGQLNQPALWAPDSTKLAFTDFSGNGWLANIGGTVDPLVDTPPHTDSITWVDANTFLYLSGSFGSWDLRIKDIGAASILIASPVGDFIPFDFSN